MINRYKFLMMNYTINH